MKKELLNILNKIGMHADRFRVKNKCKVFTAQRRHVFFGYYDISPFNYSEDTILANSAPPINRTPVPEDEISVGFYKIDEPGNFVELGKTSSWCWQQGCRLQWFPRKTGNELVFYNKIVDRCYGSVVQDINNGKIVSTYADPLYVISSDGQWGLSLDFSRLQRLRPGYGYVNLPDKTLAHDAPDDSGVWRVNLKSGEKGLVLSVRQISQISRNHSMEGAQHYFNHLCFNPSSSRFLFFHLWDNGKKRFSRLITANPDGSDIYVLDNERRVSHYTWKSEYEILYTGTSPECKIEYVLAKDKTSEKSIIGPSVLTGDGHPSYSYDRKNIITDTYPNKLGFRKLILFDTAKSSKEVLGSFFNPIEFRGETRCDLHPRISPSNKYISVDMIGHDKLRKIAIVDLV